VIFFHCRTGTFPGLSERGSSYYVRRRKSVGCRQDKISLPAPDGLTGRRSSKKPPVSAPDVSPEPALRFLWQSTRAELRFPMLVREGSRRRCWTLHRAVAPAYSTTRTHRMLTLISTQAYNALPNARRVFRGAAAAHAIGSHQLPIAPPPKSNGGQELERVCLVGQRATVNPEGF